MPRKEVRAQTIKLGEREFKTHGFLDGDNVNVFLTHVLDELAVVAIIAEAANVPEESTHQASIGGLLDPRARDALWAQRGAVREQVRPRSSAMDRGECHQPAEEGAGWHPLTRSAGREARAEQLGPR